jgi:hypothetical protein
MNFEFSVLCFNILSIPELRGWKIASLCCVSGNDHFPTCSEKHKAIPASRLTPFDQYKNKQAEKYKPRQKFTKKLNSVVNIVINFRSARLLFACGIRPTFKNKLKERRENVYISQPNQFL